MIGCPKHPEADRTCIDVRCTRTWKPEGAPTAEEQMTRWVAGESVCPNDRHECCPDFSCCKPEFLWPLEKRQKFQAASQGERMKMMMEMLGQIFSAAGKKAYITRGNPTDLE